MATYKEQVSERLLKRGDELYHAMISNFEQMFDGDIIKHFKIRDEDLHDIGSEEVMEKHGKEIQEELVKWIRSEYHLGKLFERSNWKAFRDRMEYNHMYFGYRRMFIYKNYYFQLLFDDYCNIDWGDCNYCRETRKGPHYELTLYSILNEDGTFYKTHVHDILSDNLAPEKYWNRPY